MATLSGDVGLEQDGPLEIGQVLPALGTLFDDRSVPVTADTDPLGRRRPVELYGPIE